MLHPIRQWAPRLRHVSTTDQDLSLQEAALHAAGCQVIRAERKTGTRREGRAELDILLQFLRAGDTLVITRIDRLTRSLKDLQDIVHEVKAKGVTLTLVAANLWHMTQLAYRGFTWP